MWMDYPYPPPRMTPILGLHGHSRVKRRARRSKVCVQVLVVISQCHALVKSCCRVRTSFSLYVAHEHDRGFFLLARSNNRTKEELYLTLFLYVPAIVVRRSHTTMRLQAMTAAEWSH